MVTVKIVAFTRQCGLGISPSQNAINDKPRSKKNKRAHVPYITWANMILQRNGEASQACPSMCPLVALHRYRLYFKIGGMQLLTFERAILQMRRFEERLIRKHGHLARGAYKKTLAFAMRLVAAFSCFAAVFAFPAKSYLLRAPSSFAPLTPQADSIRRNTKYVCSMGHLTNRYMAHSPSMAVRGGHTASGSLTNQKGFNKKLVSFLNKRFFLLGAAAAVSLARFAPGVGATGGFLRPEVTVNTAGETSIIYTFYFRVECCTRSLLV